MTGSITTKATAKTACWIITLAPQSDDVKKLQRELSEQGVSTRLFQGVDGRNNSPQLLDNETLQQNKTFWRHLSALTNSELGCYLSHIRALREAFEAGAERICILEDDIELEPDFSAALSELEQLPDEIEMIRLMGLKIRKRKIVQSLADGKHKLVRPERGWVGTQGYLVNRAGMKKILEQGSRIYEPIDKLYDHFWEYDLQLYGVEPHIIWEKPVTHSTVVKSGRRVITAPAWIQRLYPLGKFWRSIKRHWYLKANRKDFYPCEKPTEIPGRTERLKSSGGLKGQKRG